MVSTIDPVVVSRFCNATGIAITHICFMNSFQLKVSFILFIVIFLWQYYSNIETMDIIAVIVNMDINVVMAMELDSISVSRPIFSAVIRGRLPAGTAAMRHTASVATGSKPQKCITITKITGTKTIRIMI